jgi:hypothetical protein
VVDKVGRNGRNRSVYECSSSTARGLVVIGLFGRAEPYSSSATRGLVVVVIIIGDRRIRGGLIDRMMIMMLLRVVVIDCGIASADSMGWRLNDDRSRGRAPLIPLNHRPQQCPAQHHDGLVARVVPFSDDKMDFALSNRSGMYYSSFCVALVRPVVSLAFPPRSCCYCMIDDERSKEGLHVCSAVSPARFFVKSKQSVIWWNDSFHYTHGSCRFFAPTTTAVSFLVTARAPCSRSTGRSTRTGWDDAAPDACVAHRVAADPS